MANRLKPLSRSQRQLRDQETIHAVNAVKFVAMLVLRNQGWGDVRIRRFSNQFNEIIEDISHDRLSLTDVADALYDETGLDMHALSVGSGDVK
jgi:hypothetical protein